MRILVLDHYYPAFAEHWYATHPGLRSASYAAQRESFAASLFGGTTFEVDGLRAIGHEAAVVHINLQPAQQAWAREHGLRLPSDRRVGGIRLRRGVVPWPRYVPDARWVNAAILAQVEDFRPDVVHVQAMSSIDPALIPVIRGKARLVSGQVAAPLPMERARAGYDLVVSSLPNFVARFRAAGIDSEWLPLAFEPSVLELIGPVARDVPVSFVGSLFSAHSGRMELLEAVAALVPVDLWTQDGDRLPAASPLRGRLHDAVWGKEMYRALGASVMTINTHIDVAEDYANNLRLYEATGMGALLITDQKRNLGELFEVGSEVVAYTDAASCAELVRYYLDHPDEAARIAAAGQARTLRDHTWTARMADLVRLYEARM